MNNSKKKLIKELEENSFVQLVLRGYDISNRTIVKQYQKKSRTKDIASYALDYLDAFLAKDLSFLARFNYLFSNKKGITSIGEIMYCYTEKEYKEELHYCYWYGVPMTSSIVKGKTKELSDFRVAQYD